MELPRHFYWRSAGRTDTGMVRTVNEDALILRPEIGMWAVADGMGGHDYGDVASAAVVSALDSITFPPGITDFTDSVKDRLQAVNRDLVARAGAGGMGSTALVLVACDNQCACLWVGDSRAYRLRHNILHAMTRDHSYVEELVRLGRLDLEQAANHPDANVITRAIGAAQSLDVDVVFHNLEHGDRYLLCSDGLYREVSEQELFYHLGAGSCEEVVNTLVDLALQRGARDNVSVVVVDFSAEG